MKNAVCLTVLVLLAGIAIGCHMSPKGPFCQSCAMPINKPELFGTQSDGTSSPEYCVHCYRKGAFTDPDIAMEQMLDKCVKAMVEQKVMPEKEARELMTKYLPQMKRWKKK